jgi:hypothetical protein
MVGMVEAKDQLVSMPVILSDASLGGVKDFEENTGKTPHPGNMILPPGRSHLSTFSRHLAQKSLSVEQEKVKSSD